jgi:hypothetical protein
LRPRQRLLDQLIGPAATEVGLSLSDSVKVWRFKRQLRLLQEVKRLVEDSGKQIKPIATRLFFPVLEAASIEDDDEMQTRWAALLANEATNVGSVHPCYIDVLKQLSPDDARLLDKVCDWCERKKSRNVSPFDKGFYDAEMYKILNSHEDSLENLVRLQLIQSEYKLGDHPQGGEIRIAGERGFIPPTYLDRRHELSDFAVRFVRACRAPRQ